MAFTMSLKNGLIIYYGLVTSGAAGVNSGDVLRLSAASTVLAVNSATVRVIGVAESTAASGADPGLIVQGAVTLTADGAITAGDAIGPASTAGRCVSLNTYTPVGTNGTVSFTPSGTNSAVGTTTDANFLNSTGTVANAGNVPDATSAVSNAGNVPDASTAVSNATNIPDASLTYSLATCGAVSCNGLHPVTSGTFSNRTDILRASSVTNRTDILRAPTVTNRTDVVRAPSVTKVAAVTGLTGATPTFTGSSGTVSAQAFTGTAQNVGLVFGRAITSAAGAGNTFQSIINTVGGM